MTIFLLLGSVFLLLFFQIFKYHKIEETKNKKKPPGPNIGKAPKLCHKALKKGMDLFGMIDGIMS
jgi:hypothetical protein